MTPTTVVKIPIFFDFVHPESAIKKDKAKSPIIKVNIPMILASKKSSSVTSCRYPPGVVVIEILVIANRATRKQPAEIVAVFNKRFVNLSAFSDMIRLATMVIEKPLNKELIKII